MSREFFRRYPRRDVGESVRWRAGIGRYARQPHRNAHRLPRLGGVLMGCLYIVVAALACGFVIACLVTYIFALTMSR